MKTNLITVEEVKTPSWNGSELVKSVNSKGEITVVLTTYRYEKGIDPQNNQANCFEGTVIWSDNPDRLVGYYSNLFIKDLFKLCNDKIELQNEN